MGASGSTIINACFTANGNVTDALKFSWWENSQSISNNTTNVGWKLELISYNYGYIQSSASKPWAVTVNGEKYSGTNTVGISSNSSKVLASGSTEVEHKDDGSKNFSYSFSQTFDINFNGWVGTKSGSGSGILTTIARASQPSCITYPNHTQNVGEFGDTISIHMNRKSSAFTHTVRYEFGDQTGTIETNVGTGTTWTIPLSLMNLIPNANSGSGTIYVDTYNGSTKIGTKWCGFTATVPASVKPSCTATLEDITGIDDIYGSPVQGLSKIKVTVKPSLAYKSPIKSYSIIIDGVKYSAAEATTGFLSKSGTSKVSVIVTDSRGRSNKDDPWSYDMNVQEYTPPSITKLAVHRCNENGTANDQGGFTKVEFETSGHVLKGKNPFTYSIQYKKTSEDKYVSANMDDVVLTNMWDNGTQEGYEGYIILETEKEFTYDIKITTTDSHKSTSRTTSVSTAFSLFDVHPSGTGWRFGGVAEKEYTVQNDLSLNQVGNTYAFQPEAFSGEKGYTALATIKLNTLNVNAPIVFKINRRGALCPMSVYVRFASSSDSTDPPLGSITYEGDNYGAFLIKVATSTWKLYVDNTTGWSNPCLQEWYTTENQKARMSIEFPNEQLAGTTTEALKAQSVDNSFYRATPVVMQSIIDCLLPVGMIIQLYSHADPNTMYPGTTWVRIEEGFLWATGASGTIGQTGGEKTHTLTVAEMPSHTHNDGTDSSKGMAVTSGGGSALVYYDASTGRPTTATGGGKAHNNMPPYVQVSIWRRTA